MTKAKPVEPASDDFVRIVKAAMALRGRAECGVNLSTREVLSLIARIEAPLEAHDYKVGQAYQVIGMLLSKTGDFDTPEGQRALDYFADERLIDDDFLPWPRGNHDEWLASRDGEKPDV